MKQLLMELNCEPHKLTALANNSVTLELTHCVVSSTILNETMHRKLKQLFTQNKTHKVIKCLKEF